MKEQRQLVMLVLLLVIFAGVCGYRFFYRSITRNEFEQARVGMTPDEVTALLGKPVKVSRFFHSDTAHHFPLQSWYYNIKYSFLVAGVTFKPAPEGEGIITYRKFWGFGGRNRKHNH